MTYKEIYNDTIDERILSTVSTQGIRIFFMPKEGYSKKYAVFSTDYGSIDNIFVPIGARDRLEVPEGIAHFLEHKLFEEEDGDVFEKFSNIGAQVNAFTSFNQTSYLFYTSNNFYTGLEYLIDFVQNPYLTDENVEKEKGIIGQEIMMYEDNPGWKVYFNLLKAMYHEHPIRIDIAGTIDSIKAISKELLYTTYETFYNPSNMVLFVIGDLDFDEIVRVVNKAEKEFDLTTGDIERIIPDEPKEVKDRLVEEKMTTSMPMFYMGFKDADTGYKGRKMIKKDIVTNIILDMLFGESTEFYNKLYEEGLIDTSFGAFYTCKESYGHSLLVGQSNEPETLHNRILDRIKLPADEVLKEDDFIRIKRKELGNFIMGMNSIEFIANNFTDLFFSGFMITDYLELLKEIKYDDIIRRFNSHFKEENLSLSIIRPL
ncbi:MAG: EF-P 5-aminopentanol modification-associated protein YfmH [Tissierellaceae bacterium]|jgi:predicted Zn-dependent peptidase|nr:insulinase family protein [Tissierellia bacterium]